jgi:hypothetical protein
MMYGLGIAAEIICGLLFLFTICCLYAMIELHIQRWWRERQLRRRDNAQRR